LIHLLDIKINHTVMIQGNHTVMIQGNHTVMIQGNPIVTIQGNPIVTIQDSSMTTDNNSNLMEEIQDNINNLMGMIHGSSKAGIPDNNMVVTPDNNSNLMEVIQDSKTIPILGSSINLVVMTRGNNLERILEGEKGMILTLDRIFKIEMLLKGIMVQRALLDTPPIILETMNRSID